MMTMGCIRFSRDYFKDVKKDHAAWSLTL